MSRVRVLAGAARVRELRGLGSFLSYWACASCWECKWATIAGGDWESELTERSGLSLVLGMSMCLLLHAVEAVRGCESEEAWQGA